VEKRPRDVLSCHVEAAQTAQTRVGVPMKPGLVDSEVAGAMTEGDFAAPLTRRKILGRLSAALAGSAIVFGLHSGAADARRKKKKQKKAVDKPLKPSDWDGFWNTRLSNGVSGTANLSYEDQVIFGTYSNSVGNGDFRCYTITDANPFSCQGPWYQTDGSTGFLSMELEDAEHWSGTYQIQGGDSGTWSGAR
jgi:hypothetical protein